MDVDRSFRVFPGGSNGEFDLPAELATVVRRGVGCELRDTRDRRFVDFSMGWGSVLVGHARPEVVEAVVRRAPQGSNFSYITEDALCLAEEIVRLSPACDRVRFCASGTEATMYCLRLARASTGRPKVLKFEGAYHGANDVGVTSLFPDSEPDYPHGDPTSAGLEPGVRESVLVAPFNDLDRAGELIAAHASEIAAVIVEPLQRCIPPAEGFLAGLREVTTRHGALLVFDEVVTGFRLAYAGAQERYGVVPDLVAYGKALGGGYPIGVFGGRKEILDLVREDCIDDGRYVWVAATLGGNPISCAAARAALMVLRQDGVYERLDELGDHLRHGMRRVLDDAGVVGRVIGDGPLAQVVFTGEDVVDYRTSRCGDRRLARRVMLGLFRKGIFLNPMGTKLYLSLAHEESHCDELLEALGEVLREEE